MSLSHREVIEDVGNALYLGIGGCMIALNQNLQLKGF